MPDVARTRRPWFNPTPVETLGLWQSLKSQSPDTRLNYNTSLNPNQETEFQRWSAKNKRTNDLWDYDMPGWWVNNGMPTGTMAAGHFPDTYKKPSHPTFSDESQYSSPAIPGGHWGQNSYQPSIVNRMYRPQSALEMYFRQIEPGTKLQSPWR